jgi:signal peptidase I
MKEEARVAPAKRPTRQNELLREAASLAVVVVILSAGRSTLADHYHVPTGSMQPTVEPRDRLVVSKLAYGVRVPFSTTVLWEFAGPQRGDVVVLESPVTGETLLKRVIATPGDRVAVRGGRVAFGEGEALLRHEGEDWQENLGNGWHAVRLTRGGGPDLEAVEVPPDHYLVMGDNRGESFDGRAFGFVRRLAIYGRAVAVVYRSGLCWQAL